ncbi:hypothetical protein UJ11_003551 [Salmonella enterica subsp. enterica]|nr:hypothetical protein [Salmonella enterica subsp. enterica serovar Baguida]
MTNNQFTNEQLEYFSAAACEIIDRGAVTSYERAASKVIIRLVAELQERRQADSAEPACYALTNVAGEVYNTHSSAQNAGAYRDLIHQSDDSLTLRVTPLYAVPSSSVTGIYDDVLNIIGLLENNEWAEHCTRTVLGSILESEITRLVGKEPPPLSEAEREELNRLRIATCDHGLGGAHTQGVIGCERCAGRMVYAWGVKESR